MSDVTDRLIASLSGEYKVIAPAWVTDEDCREVVEALEEAGSIPYRSVAQDGSNVDLGLGGGGKVVELQGRECWLMIFGRTIGIVPQPK